MNKNIENIECFFSCDTTSLFLFFFVVTGLPSNVFFQLMLISWMVWQIISFILPSNGYGCVYAWTTLGNTVTDRLTEDANFGKNIIFSNEVHLDPGGYINKQNCRIWGTEYQHAYIEKPTHPKRVTVWGGFWSSGIIGSP